MNFSTEQQDAFERDGFIIVSGLFEPEQISAASREIERLTYGKSFGQWLAERESGIVDEEFVPGRSQFPAGSAALDSLLANDAYLDGFASCLGTDEIAYCNAHLFVRSGMNDMRHAPEPWQGYHIDNDTCSFLPPHPDVMRHHYINSWIMLSDIDEDGAPLHVIPGSHLQIADVLPHLSQEGDAMRAGFSDIRLVPEFARPVPVTGKAGDVLFYSSYLVHGAVRFTNKRKQRAVWTMSIGRADNLSWNRYSHLYHGSDRDYAIPFWSETTARVRSVFGWPPPGDSYYTPQTLELLSNWFPEMDLKPYRDGLLEVVGAAAANLHSA